jgi:hypothetical protein
MKISSVILPFKLDNEAVEYLEKNKEKGFNGYNQSI